MCRQCAEDPSIIRTMAARCRADRKLPAAVLGQGWAVLQRAIVERPRAAGFVLSRLTVRHANFKCPKLTRAVPLDSLGDLLVALRQRDRRCVHDMQQTQAAITAELLGRQCRTEARRPDRCGRLTRPWVGTAPLRLAPANLVIRAEAIATSC